MAAKKTEGKISIEGVGLNVSAIKSQKPKVLKGDIAEMYFGGIPESKRQDAADALWAAINDKDTAASDLQHL